MKKYERPEIEIICLDPQNKILISGQALKVPKTVINGEKATGIGEILFSDYTWN